MSTIVPVLRAIVRDELPAAGPIDLGTVTEVATNDGGSGDRNTEANVRLRGSALELQRVPVAAGRAGLSSVPRVGDLVVVAFVGGDLNAAVVLGTLHTDAVHPPDAKPQEVVYEVPDPAEAGVRRLAVLLPGGSTLTVEDDKVVIELSGSVVTIDGGNVSVVADQGITLESKGDISIKAQGDLSLEAGASATLKASASLTAESSGAAKLKGATTTIAGVTSFSAG